MNILYKTKTVFILILAVFLIIFDRFLKFLAFNHFFAPKIDIIKDVLSLNLAKNYYIAFSLPFSGWILNILIIVIIFSLGFYWLILNKKNYFWIQACLTFIIFGAISNLLDRIKYGFVIDYFDLKYFTVFNLADVMIVGGVVSLLLVNFLYTKKPPFGAGGLN